MKISVGTDFSSRCDRAIDRALQVGAARGAVVRVIHALDHMETDSADWGRLERKMRETIGDAPCETESAFVEGSPPLALARDCETQQPDILFIGPARYNSLGDYFLGTSVDYVLRNTSRPVIVVKQRARSPYRHLIAGTDFSAGSALAIERAAKLFPDAALHIVHAWRVPFAGFQRDAYVGEEIEADAQAKMGQFFAEIVSRTPALKGATTAVAKGNTHHAIMQEIDKCSDNAGEVLVVVGSHGTSGFRQATLGSQTSDLLRYLANDVLVVNTAEADG